MQAGLMFATQQPPNNGHYWYAPAGPTSNSSAQLAMFAFPPPPAAAQRVQVGHTDRTNVDHVLPKALILGQERVKLAKQKQRNRSKLFECINPCCARSLRQPVMADEYLRHKRMQKPRSHTMESPQVDRLRSQPGFQAMFGHVEAQGQRNLDSVAPLHGFHARLSPGPTAVALRASQTISARPNHSILTGARNSTTKKQVRFSDRLVARQFLHTREEIEFEMEARKRRESPLSSPGLFLRMLDWARLKHGGPEKGQIRSDSAGLAELDTDTAPDGNQPVWYLEAEYSLASLTGLYPEEIAAIQSMQYQMVLMQQQYANLPVCGFNTEPLKHRKASPIPEVDEESSEEEAEDLLDVASTSDFFIGDTTPRLSAAAQPLLTPTPYRPTQLGLDMWRELHSSPNRSKTSTKGLERSVSQHSFSDDSSSIHSNDDRWCNERAEDAVGSAEPLCLRLQGPVEVEEEGPKKFGAPARLPLKVRPQDERRVNLVEGLLARAKTPAERRVAESLSKLSLPEWAQKGLYLMETASDEDESDLDWTLRNKEVSVQTLQRMSSSTDNPQTLFPASRPLQQQDSSSDELGSRGSRYSLPRFHVRASNQSNV